MNHISHNTLIPISALVIIVGGVFWLSDIHFKTEANAKALETMERRGQFYIESIDSIKGTIQDIRERVIRIESKMERGK